MNEKKIATSLREGLIEWTDYDVAAYKLGCIIGIFPPFDGDYSNFRENKALFWTTNHLGDSLVGILDSLVEHKVLELDDENQRYRWNAKFTVELDTPTKAP